MLALSLRTAAVAALLLAAPVAAQVAVTQPWARATAPLAKAGAAYLTITNSGSKPDRLLGGSTPAAGQFELHQTLSEGGVMRMRPIEGGLVIRPGETVRAAPGGMHIMLMGLKAPLVAGTTVPATLRFERAGEVRVSFKVEPAGATAPARH